MFDRSDSASFTVRALILVCLLLLFSPLVQALPTSQPPLGSWERWVQGIRSNGRGGMPGRPDAKSLDSELPLWVDCHLSWYFDRPAHAEKSKLASQLVLRSDAKLCKGQLEQWAR